MSKDNLDNIEGISDINIGYKSESDFTFKDSVSKMLSLSFPLAENDNGTNLIESKDFSSLEFADKITYLLNSQEYKSLFNNKVDLVKSIGIMIEFFTIFDSLDFYKYLEFAKNILDNYSEKSSIIYSFLKNSFGNKDLTNEEVFDFVSKKYLLEGYYFHCFNGINEESIKLNGLSSNLRDFDEKDIDKIIEISLNANVSVRHYEPKKTWFYTYLGNCQGKISFGKNDQQISHYLLEVPEWYAIFVSNCTESMLVRDAFRRKQDYSLIQKETINSLEKIVPDIEDRIFLLSFIEKYRKRYTKFENKVALVKKELLDGCISLKELSKYKNNVLDFSRTPEEVISFILGSNKPYFSTSTNLLPNDVLIVSPGIITDVDLKI